MEDDRIHNCNNDELGALLHKLLVVDSNEEVVVYNSEMGEEQVITKENYLETIKHLERAKNMSPSQRLIENKRLKIKKQLQLRTALVEAKTYMVDLNNDETFGLDVDGNKIDIEGMIFVPIKDYLPQTDIKEFEVGAFIDESMRKPPLRILAKEPLKPEE